MNNYCVYMHINKINNKKYVGITCQKPEHRWKNDGSGYSKQSLFFNAIKKYGWDNFEHVIIAKGLTEDEAKWLEIELIRVNDSTNQSKGYNVTEGGEGTKGIRRYGKDNPNYGKGERIRGENNPRYGKGYLITGKNNPRAKSVICLTTKRLFLTAKEGGEFYNTDCGNICSCCKGRLKSSGKLSNGTKLVWKYVNHKHNRRYRIKKAM